MVVIAGALQWAYDSDSLIALEPELTGKNAMWNYHPYMGPKQYKGKKEN